MGTLPGVPSGRKRAASWGEVRVKMPDVTVTVIIPTYNHGDVVGRAVQSVLQQTFRDFEILVVDDGSEDDTRRLIEAMRERPIRYVSQEHRGRSAARNHGMRLARGRYIAFLDADDFFFQSKLERQLAEMEEFPQYLLSHTSYVRVNGAGVPTELIRSGRFAGDVFPGIWWACPIAASTVIMRREVVRNGLSFCEQVHIGEDILLWAQVAEQGDILGIDECLTGITLTGTNSALLHEHQILAARNLMDSVAKGQHSLDPGVARRIRAELKINMAASHFAMRRYREFAVCALQSHGAWPFNHRLYSLAARKCWATAVRNIRKGTALLRSAACATRSGRVR